MKFLITTLLIASTISVSAQDRKTKFGAQLFPNFSTGIPVKKEANSLYHRGIETFAFSGSIGLQVDHDLNQKWIASAGLLYKYVRENGTTIPADPYRGVLYPEEFDFSLGYVELQLNAARKIGKHWIAEAGLSPAWMVEGVYTNYFSDYVLKLDDSERNSFGLNMNLGFGFRAEKGNMCLRVMPYTQLDALKAVNRTQAYFHGHPSMRFFAIGLRTTITF